MNCGSRAGAMLFFKPVGFDDLLAVDLFDQEDPGEDPEEHHSDEEEGIGDLPVDDVFRDPGILGHAADAGDEVEGEKNDIDEGQIFKQDVHVVVDDVAAGVHEVGQNRGINLRLAAALLVLDHDVVQQLQLFFRKVHFFRVGPEFCQGGGVGFERVQIIDEAFAQIEHLEQVGIFHRHVQFGLQFRVDLPHDFQVPEEMMDGVQEKLQDDAVQRHDPLEFFGGEGDRAFAQNQCQPVLFQKDAQRGHLEF